MKVNEQFPFIRGPKRDWRGRGRRVCPPRGSPATRCMAMTARGVYGGPVWRGCQPLRGQGRIARLTADAWQRLRAGAGSQGPRLYDWVVIPLTPPWTPGWCRWLLARRRLEAPTALADDVVSASEPTPLAEMGRLAGSRWSLAACREATTGEVGRDQSDGRLGSAGDRHITRAR